MTDDRRLRDHRSVERHRSRHGADRGRRRLQPRPGGAFARTSSTPSSTRSALERGVAVEADVTDWEDNERLVQAALDRFGRIDVVFANAGFGVPAAGSTTRPSTGARWS